MFCAISQLFFFFRSFFHIYLAAPSSTQNPYHSRVIHLIGGFGHSVAVTDYGNVLRRVINLL